MVGKTLEFKKHEGISNLCYQFWLLPLVGLGFPDLKDLLSLGLSVSSILVASAAFLLGIYLSAYDKIGKKRILTLYWVAVLSVLVSAIIIIFVSGINVFQADIDVNLKNYLLIITLVPLVPVALLFTVLMAKFPR